jgi:hypothetical protein
MSRAELNPRAVEERTRHDHVLQVRYYEHIIININ